MSNCSEFIDAKPFLEEVIVNPATLPEAVLLVHGTFAFENHAGEQANKPWWSPHSEFCTSLNRALDEKAACWPEDVQTVFPWFNRRPWWKLGYKQYYDRDAFTWSGENSEVDRRKAAARLLQGLRQLEDRNRPYHLVGHSYGGAVIWYALIQAEREMNHSHSDRSNPAESPLKCLRSWTTLGAPFPEYRPKPFAWLRAIIRMIELAGTTALLALCFYWFGLRHWPSVLAHIPWTTWAFISILICSLIWSAWDFIPGVYKRLRFREDQYFAKTAWQHFGSNWLGLYSPADEATSALRMSVGLYARIPVGSGLLWWLLRPLVWTVELPLNWFLRIRAQGSPWFGTVLASVNSQPLPVPNPAGPLPEELELALKSQAQHLKQEDLDLAFKQFEEFSRRDTPAWSFIESLRSNVFLRVGLYHTAYYRIDSIRSAIAYHIGKKSIPPVNTLVPGLTHDTSAWLEGNTPLAEQPALQRSLDTTPFHARVPYLVLILLVAWLSLSGLYDAFYRRYVPYLSAQMDSPVASEREEAVTSLFNLGKIGESALIDKLLVVAAAAKPKDNETAPLKFVEDSLKTRGSGLVPLLIQKARSLTIASERIEIISLLGLMKGEAAGATDYLCDLLGDEYSADEQDEAIRALTQIGPPAGDSAAKRLETIAATPSRRSVQRKLARQGLTAIRGSLSP